jgi:hypothetical protein
MYNKCAPQDAGGSSVTWSLQYKGNALAATNSCALCPAASFFHRHSNLRWEKLAAELNDDALPVVRPWEVAVGLAVVTAGVTGNHCELRMQVYNAWASP